MPFKRRRSLLVLTEEEETALKSFSRSRTEPSAQVERAKILLAYAGGESISSIARRFETNRPKIERCVDKALQLGALTSLRDLPRSGRKQNITPEARAWLVDLACQKPKDLGYSYELWTTRLLAKHAREHGPAQGHPCLSKLVRGTVSKILSQREIRPHKIRYYLEKRDPEFDVKMKQVLCVYKEVQLLREASNDVSSMVAILSYDEKPGIQALQGKAPDLPPVPGKFTVVSRDYEYIRHGTVSLMAGIDLLTGKVHAQVVDRHRSREFVQFLKMVDKKYAPEVKIRIILDNHSAHISKETRGYLATVPNRFDFVFTPTHGSWLNLIEMFFSKMAKTMLRGIRVSSKQELKDCIMQFIDEINADPVIFKWSYKLDSISVA
ncbi:MAG: IS630 family transposase [Thermodesulfobacteriota bacterium]|nr:IS630 family transposase [Thermodesulfobacteriota bacterium]